MATKTVTVEAIYEDGVLRPVPPLPLAPHQRVTVTLQVPADADVWPEPVADAPSDEAAAGRQLAEAQFVALPETWPVSER